ncbi:MAG: prephenate dehydratase [Chitinophagales bacterium]
MQVAIQGIRGCFHQIAAFKYFGEREVIESIECETFPQMFHTFQKQPNYYGVMAIENTVAGTILPNYAMLRNSEMKIIGEVYLRIQHHLLSVDGQKVENIQEVHSHPMAILQCQNFLDKHHLKPVETIDTAWSAKELSEKRTRGRAAIASSLAADYYKLEIVAEGIETNKRNFTRFLVLQHKEFTQKTQLPSNKASICFHLVHEVGSLAKTLTILSEQGINLTKIQSLPVVGKAWEYFFHLDVEFSDYDGYRKSLEAIQPYINELQILGEYQRGVKHRTI